MKYKVTNATEQKKPEESIFPDKEVTTDLRRQLALPASSAMLVFAPH